MGRTTLKVTKSGGGYSSLAKMDTITYRNLTYIFSGQKPPVRAGAILRNVQLRPGTLYSQESQSLTLQQLSRMNIFSSLNFSFTPRSNLSSDTLDMMITAQLDKPYDFSFELNATSKSNSQIGPGSKVSLAKNNIFRGGETLKLSLFGSYEWQTDDEVRGRESVINSWEIGSSLSLSFPRLFMPFVDRKYLRYPSSTSFSVYGNQLNRSGFFKMVHVGGEAAYTLNPKHTTVHKIIPFRLTYDMLQRTTEKFDSIISTNRSIANSFRNQFIPAMQYTATYDNASTSHRNKTWWENSVTSSGNLVSLAFCAFGEEWDKKDKNIFGNPYAQFMKFTTEVRNLFRID
jgi:outer membrane translocation and assembly module TamA